MARGHQVTCLIPSWDSRPDSGRRYRDSGVDVVHLSALPGPAGFAVAADCLQSMWRSAAADAGVVHLFKPLGPPAAVALALQVGRALGASGRLVLDTDDWEEGWARRSGSLLVPLMGLFERRLLRSAEAVTAASEALVQMASELRRSSGSVWHLPNGVPASVLTRAPEPAALRGRLGLADVPLLLLFTRYTECPPPRLVEVLSAALSRSPSAHLLVVGTGFADEEERLREGLEERGLVGRVHFAGWVPSAGLESYLSAADVALFPCDDDPVMRAKCSVKLVQLLARGVPVVAEAVGSCRSYITHGQTGLLVPPGATKDMAEAAAGLLASPAERERLGRAAREQMAAQFSWNTLAERAEQAYAGD